MGSETRKHTGQKFFDGDICSIILYTALGQTFITCPLCIERQERYDE
jgi:hypothetical protein